MEPALWNRVEQLLQDALDREPGERAAFLDEAVGGEPDLRREVDALLAHEHDGAALSVSPVAGLVARSLFTPATLTGQSLGQYRVAARIGTGGMGEVYEAHDARLQRTVAIKALPEELASDPERSRRFEQEALAVSKLNHPNIITLFELVDVGQARYIVAEHVEGHTLRELLTDAPTGQPRALPLGQALDIAAQVAAALRAAHTAWIIHRDVKPENIMVRADGLVKVLDFGIAKHSGATGPAAPAEPPDAAAMHEGAYLTVAGAVVGTRGYMSPEQGRGESLDGRTDLYSLGLVLYEMLTGNRYPAEAGQSTAGRVVGRLPSELRGILRRLLAGNREERYGSASELAADLDRVRARASGRSARRMVVAGAIAILAAAAVTTIAALLSVSERWEEKVLRDGHTAAARQAIFSPDGRLLVSGSEDGRVIVWDFARRQRLATFTGPRTHRIALSPDGRWLASGGADGTVVIREMQRHAEPRTLRGHRGPIGALGFSPDGGVLLSSASDGSSGETILWRTSDWTKARQWPTGATGSAVLFSPHRPQVALSGSWIVHDLDNGATSMDSHGGNWASLSPDATSLATVDPLGQVAFYRFSGPVDLRRRELLERRRGHQDHGRAIAFSPDGRLVASGAEAILLWDATSRQKVARFEHSAIVWSLAFHPTGRWLVSSHADGAVLVWEVAERELVANLSEHSGAVRSVAFAPDGSRVASGGEDRTVVIWDPRTGRKQAVLQGHRTRVASVAFMPGADGLASVDQDGVTILWDLRSGRPREVIEPSAWTPAYSVAVSADGRHLASSNGLYSLPHGRMRVVFTEVPGWEFQRVYGVAFSPDGKRLAAVTDGGWVLLYATASGRLLEKRHLAGGQIAVGFSPDGQLLVTGEDEGAVRLWSVSPLRQVAVLGRHAARVKSVVFSPEGDTVASAGDDRTIALWDVARRRLRATIGTHASPVYSIAFSPDGRRLVSGEHDRSVRIYTRQRSIWGFRLD